MDRRLGRLALLAAALLLLVAPLPRPTHADQAPFWESPVGLVPGHPTMQVRMAGETVDVQVLERGAEIRAAVQATFTMANDGEEIQLKVGFPAYTTSLFDELVEPDASGRRFADAPVMFSPWAIRSFRVAVDGRELRSWRQDVPGAAAAGFGADWLMWEMTFPARQSVQVDVAYEQVLTDRAADLVVQPTYVLRTGALWHGVIGEATVTLSAPVGGVFIGGPELFMRTEDDGSTATYPRQDQVAGPDEADVASPTRVVWRLREVDPIQDVGATYVRASAWRELADAERAILSGTPTAEQLRRGAEAALALLGGPTACTESPPTLCLGGPHGRPLVLVERLAPTAREWARRAAELAPDDGAALLTFGDLEHWHAMPGRRHHGELGCWPSVAADAYERAETLGASGAAPRLEGLRQAARYIRFFADARLETCSGDADQRLDVELVKGTVEQGNGAWSRAVARGGTAELYPPYFAGRWLEERTAEVAELRRAGQYRDARLEALQFTAVSFADPTTATVETVEVWQDRTYAEDRTVVRDASGRLRQRYELQKLDGLWKIVDAAIVRE